jgi:thiamine kinase-like enzyme
MDHFDKIYTNIKNFLSRHMANNDHNELELDFEKLNGLSNDIYLVKIFNKTKNEMVHEVIYRQFGEISDLVDRNLETCIIRNLSDKGLTPKIYETDGSTYRIEEFISNSNTLEKDCLTEESVIERIIQILVSYTMISGIHKYHINSKSLSQEYKIEIDPELTTNSNTQRISQNMFDMCMIDMLTKAKKNFERFSKVFEKKCNKFIDQEIMAKLEKIKFYIKNYHDIFSKIFPKNGLLVLNHNDVHRLNLLLSNDKEKLFILDHEYSALNLVGIDIVNYMIESNFDYTAKSFPFYQFSSDEINFESYFEIFKTFMEKFEKSRSNLLQEESSRKHFQKMKTFKYFLRLVCVISLFWLLYSVIYFDYESFTLQKTFDYFQHASDRLFIFEKAYKKLESINEM